MPVFSSDFYRGETVMDPQPNRELEVPAEDSDARLPPPTDEPPIGTDIVPPDEQDVEEPDEA
jgi:hypothetical protein